MKRIAIFVGINTYPESPLRCARADAEALYREFHGKYDATKLLVDRNASPERITSEIEKCQKALSPGDMFLFYFSGHGCEQKGKRLIAIPQFDVQGNYMDVAGLTIDALKAMTDVKGLHRLFVLDCCRSVLRPVDDIMARGKMAGYMDRHGGRSIIQPTILSSSAPGQTSYEHIESGHGYFTEAFLAAIRNSEVRSFNMFRDRLDFEMQSLRTPASQDPYFEGGIGSNLPFWPDWTIDGSVTSLRKPICEQLPQQGCFEFGEMIWEDGTLDSSVSTSPSQNNHIQHVSSQISNGRKLFHLRVDDTFELKGRGFVVTGIIEDGDIEIGKSVEIFNRDKLFCTAKIIGIELNGSLIDIGHENDNVGLLIQTDRKIAFTDLVPGMVLRSLDDEFNRSSNQDKRRIPCRRKKSDYPHVVKKNNNGGLAPAPGYAWMNSNSADDYRVIWKPGFLRPDISHVVASDDEGFWIPEVGYKWASKSGIETVRQG